MQTLNFRYDARGRLTHINDPSLYVDPDYNEYGDDVFGQEIMYKGTITSQNGTICKQEDSDEVLPDVVPQYNNNVAAVKWKSISLRAAKAPKCGCKCFQTSKNAGSKT